MDVIIRFAPSQAIARNGSGPPIATIGATTYLAYMTLTDIHLAGTRKWVPRWPWPWLWPGRETYRIDSAPSPLTFSSVSSAGASENLQVYSGPLNVSWTRKVLGFFPVGEGETVSTVTVNLRYRTDTNNQLLPCFSSADLSDRNALICMNIAIPIVRGANTCVASMSAKSNAPFRVGTAQADPAVYVIRNPELRVDPVCLFGS